MVVLLFLLSKSTWIIEALSTDKNNPILVSKTSISRLRIKVLQLIIKRLDFPSKENTDKNLNLESS